MPNYTYYITEEAWKSFSNAMKILKAEVDKVGNTYFIGDPDGPDGRV